MQQMQAAMERMADAITATTGHIQDIAATMASLQQNVQQNRDDISNLIEAIRHNPNPAQQNAAPVNAVVVPRSIPAPGREVCGEISEGV